MCEVIEGNKVPPSDSEGMLEAHVGATVVSEHTSLPFNECPSDDTVQALLHCAKNSMNMLKNRIQSRSGGTGAFLFVQKPFFEVGFCWLALRNRTALAK